MVSLYRCPRKLAEDMGARGACIADAFSFYGMLNRYQQWPEAGGVMDQAATFVRLVSTANDEKAAIEREEREEADAKRKADEVKAKVRNRGH